MGVPPPLGRSQTKFYAVQGLPANLDPEHNPVHRRIVCEFQDAYKSYVERREDLGRAFNAKFKDFRISFRENDVEGTPFNCDENGGAKSAARRGAKKKRVKNKKKSTKTRAKRK